MARKKRKSRAVFRRGGPRRTHNNNIGGLLMGVAAITTGAVVGVAAVNALAGINS